MNKNLIVIKYGGNAMTDIEKKEKFLQNIAKLSKKEKNLIIVHGGGPEINEMLNKIGKESKFIQGNRVSDKEIVEIAEMVLAGKVNKGIVGELNNLGVKAIGLSGKDAGLLEAKKKYLNLDGDKIDIGFVGEITKVNGTILELLLANGYLPVISTIGLDKDGNTYNINADYVAGEIAGVLKAEKLLFFTDVDGIYKDFEDKNSLIAEIEKKEVLELIKNGNINGGMLPKVNTCLESLDKGVSEVVILNGKIEGIIDKYFSNEKVGTAIKA